MKSKQGLPVILPTMLVFIAAAVFFGLYDLEITKAFINEESTFGLTLEVLGEAVAPLLAALAGEVLLVCSIRFREFHRRILYLLSGFLILFVGFGYMVTIYLEISGIEFWAFLLITLFLLILAGILLFRSQPRTLDMLFRFAVFTICYLVSVLVIINLIKIGWGRIRPRDLLADTDFSNWFLPQGLTGNRSFPSGHTANAATLWVLTLFAPLCKKNWKKILCYLIPILWILTMAVSRVIVGAHYSSDVLFGGSISILLFYLVRKMVAKRIRLYQAKTES